MDMIKFYVDRILNSRGLISLEDVPMVWREEVKQEIKNRIMEDNETK